MFDVGRTLLAAVERAPNADAVIDGETRFTYVAWFETVSRLVAGLDSLGLKKGDHLATALQNRWEAAALHWACQMAGIVITPLNWRVTGEELDYFLENAEARALAFEGVTAEATAASNQTSALPRITIGGAAGGTHAFDDLVGSASADAGPRANAQDISLMLYTSGTTGRGKGVPRRHQAERAAALAHVAQNCYRPGERTLGVMPLYHTMGVRSLLAMALVDGCFVCLPHYSAKAALSLIAHERLSNLYLVPTLYHDLLASEAFADTDISAMRKLGFAGAPMTDALLKRVDEAFKPEMFVNHYGSSEIYTFTICQDPVAKPGSAGKPGLNQRVRVVRAGTDDPEERAHTGEEGEIIASLESDEAFEGYWRRPEADAKALKGGWYFTGDLGYLDEEGDLFVTGRVDDMIITGGENVSPVEIESVLSHHPAVEEIAVAGLEDERWGQSVTAFIKRRATVDPEALDAHCRASSLANFKRPRRYVFVTAIPKSPVGKILRRKLIAGEYETEQN